VRWRRGKKEKKGEERGVRVRGENGEKEKRKERGREREREEDVWSKRKGERKEDTGPCVILRLVERR
jgi:hypothetical protein